MRNIAKFFVTNAKFTFVVTIFFILIGVMGLLTINSESYPSVNFAMATITTVYPGATADDIEAKITIPIEDEIRKVSGLKDVRSVSQAGRSEILVRVDMDNEDEVAVLTDLEKAVDRVTRLPADLIDPPIYTEINSEEFPAIELALTGPNDKLQRDELAKKIEEDLEDSKSVLEVRLVNYTDPEFWVELNQEKLEQFHLGADEVLNAIRLRNFSAPGGDLENDQGRALIRVDGKTKTIEDLNSIVLRSNFTGEHIQLSQVARVKKSFEKRDVLAHYNDSDATLMVVTKKAGADTLKLVDEVEAKIKKYTDDQFKLNIYINEAQKVKNRLEVLTSNALSGLVLVIFFLFLFLPGRIGLMASLSLPIALMGTIGLMPSFGMNLDMITILALIIALGMLVDNAVVISENFTRLRHEGFSSEEAILQSIQSLWFPITATALTTIAAFLPMLVTKGIMGQFIKWIPVVVCLSLVLSLVESFFLLPMRLNLVGNAVKADSTDPSEAKQTDWFVKVQNKFEAFMAKCVKHRYIVGFIFGLVLVGSMVMLTKFNTFYLFPAEQTEIYLGRLELQSDARVEKTLEVGSDIVKDIKRILGDDVAHITLRAGTNKTRPDDAKGKTDENVALIIIYMTKQASFDRYYADVLKELGAIKHPDAKDISFQEQVNGPPVGDAVNVTFRSSDHAQLDSLVEKLKVKLAETKGIFNVRDDLYRGADEITIQFDYPKMARLGLNVQSVAGTVKTAFQGNIAAYIVKDDEEIGIKVLFRPEDKISQNNLSQIKVLDARGNLIPVSSFAKLEIHPGTPILKRYDYKKSKTITASIDPKVINSPEANKKLASYFNELKKDHRDVSAIFGGEQESTNESLQSLAQAGVLAIIGIYAILVLVFNSFLRPAVIISTIPLGLVGFSIAFYFHNRPVSFLALIGIIGLAGIIVNSGIVLISFIDELRTKDNTDLNTILAKASGMRLRAVVVTSLTTISGLLPTAYGIGGYEATLIPMTLAMAWGLTSGTILTLVWVPCAYAIVEDFSTFFGKIFTALLNFPKRILRRE